MQYPTRSEGLRSTSPLQPMLLDALPPVVQPEYDGKQSIQERFEAFDATNPHVREALRNLALSLKRKGVRRWGMKNLYERLRYEYGIQTGGDEGFRLNNDFTALFARSLMAETPELDGFFETRERRAD